MKYWQSGFDSQIKISQQQLLAVSQKISQQYKPKASSLWTKLVLLPVDPFHLYAYWVLCDTKYQRIEDFRSRLFKLRIYCHHTETLNRQNSPHWFDVSVNRIQEQQRIKVPHDNLFYSGAIGRDLPGKPFMADYFSNVIHIPSREAALSCPVEKVEKPEPGEQLGLDKCATEDTHSNSNSINDVIEQFTIKDNLFAKSKKAAIKMTPSAEIKLNKKATRWSSGYGIGKK